MSKYQCYESGDYIKGVLTHTHCEWMNKANEWKWEFLGELSLRVEMKCLVETSLPPKSSLI